MSWFAVRIDTDTFATVDFFANQSCHDAHVAGLYASALKGQADELVVGSRDDDVPKAVQVLSAAI